MAPSSPNYFFLLRKLPLTVLVFCCNIISATSHENAETNRNPQQSLFRGDKTNDDKVEILHQSTTGNNSAENIRYYAGEFNGNKILDDYRRPVTQNYYPSNPVFIPNSYGSHNSNPYGQRPPGYNPLGFPQFNQYPQSHLGNKANPFFGRYPLLDQFQNSLIPPKEYFPFNPSPPIDPSLANYYPSHQNQFHGREPIPSYPGFIGGPSYGQGSGFHFGLPKQVKVPGRIEISLSGTDAEITCEFPRYLILMQKIYWHHKYDDPYGSYYDDNNGFGPRIRVVSSDQWRSVLQIRDFNEDDYGPYRCISSAVLPDDGGVVTNRNLFTHDKQISSTEASSTSHPIYTDHPYQFDSEEGKTKKSKSSTKQKSRNFSNSRKIRFIRDTKHKDKHNAESNLIASPEIYDPFSSAHSSGRYDYFPYTNKHYSQINYLPTTRGPPNYYNSASGSSPKLGFPLPNSQQPSYDYHNYNPYQYDISKYPSINYGQSSAYGLNAPYYKPKYSIFTIYQEINFAPLDYKPSTVSSIGK